MSECLTTIDELIRAMCEDPSAIETRALVACVRVADHLQRAMCEDPSAIETRALGSDMVWAFVPRQVALDDWDEYGVVLICKRYDALMATYAGIDATAPDDDEVPA